MQIPSQIKILGSTWEIEIDPLLSDKGEAIGQCHADKQTIILDTTVPQERLQKTFIHEITHALMDVLGMDRELKIEEVCNLTPLLFQVLKDNDLI